MCTAISFTPRSAYLGRTLDIERTYGEQITLIPRNYEIVYRHMQSGKNHPAILGMSTIVDNYPLIYDAFNEHGLGIAGLNFVGNAHFGDIKRACRNVCAFELPLWILSECRCVGDAVMLLRGSNIIGEDFSASLPCAELHWMICDRERSITVEQTRGGLDIYENPIGVLTNNPPFPHQLSHLCQYMALSAEEPECRFSAEAELLPYSRGLGAVGLPGDWSSGSRFVRAAFAKLNSSKPTDSSAEVNQLFHILSSVEVPEGVMRLREGSERTEYAACCDLDRGIYYCRTYGCSRIIAVRMEDLMLDAHQPVSFPLVQGEDIRYLSAPDRVG